MTSTTPTHDDDYYAVENTVRLGRYPGRIIAQHASHWDAVAECGRLAQERTDREIAYIDQRTQAYHEWRNRN